MLGPARAPLLDLLQETSEEHRLQIWASLSSLIDDSTNDSLTLLSPLCSVICTESKSYNKASSVVGGRDLVPALRVLLLLAEYSSEVREAIITSNISSANLYADTAMTHLPVKIVRHDGFKSPRIFTLQRDSQSEPIAGPASTPCELAETASEGSALLAHLFSFVANPNDNDTAVIITSLRILTVLAADCSSDW